MSKKPNIDPNQQPLPPPGASSGPVYPAGPYQGPYYYGGGMQPQGDDFITIDLMQIWQVLRKRWRLCAAVLGAVLGLTILYVALAPRVYEATSSVELNPRRPRILGQQAAVIEDPASGQQFESTMNTQLEKFRSPIILPYVLDLYREVVSDDERDEDEISKWLANNVEFSLVRRTRLVEISFRDRDPRVAMLTANAFAAAAEAMARNENREASDSAVAWLEAQARVQQQEVDRADRALSRARQEFRLDVLQGQRETARQSLITFNEALTEIERDLAKERELLSVLDALELTPENAGLLPAGIPRSDEIADALDRWLVAVTERDAMLAHFTREHPDVVAKDQAIQLLRDQAMAAIGRARTTTAANIRLLEQQATSLRSNKEAQNDLAAELEKEILDREMQLSSYQRARDAANLSYQGVLNRIQEARLSADENTTTVKMVVAAPLPESPIKPRVLIVLLLGGMLGGGLAVVYALVVERLEDHVDGVDDVEVGCHVKILGIVPHVECNSRKEMATATLNNRFGVVTEAFATLRSSLDAPDYAGRNKVMLVASSVPAEGKTSTCCNLAVVLARSGHKTLLIDFDLRRPRINSIFPMPTGHTGLLDYLQDANRENPDELAYAVDGCPNLEVIASRPVKGASPAELMGGQKMNKLLAWARENYDRVILDAPPLGILSDALVLSGLSDFVLIMARPGTSRKRVLRYTIKRFKEYGAANLAAVVNDVDLSKATYDPYSPYHHYAAHSAAYLTPEAEDEVEMSGAGRKG